MHQVLVSCRDDVHPIWGVVKIELHSSLTGHLGSLRKAAGITATSHRNYGQPFYGSRRDYRQKPRRDYVRKPAGITCEIRGAFRESFFFAVFLILHGRGRKSTVSGNSSGNSFAKLREIGRGLCQEYFLVVRIFFGNNKKQISVGSSSQELDANKFTPEAPESWRRTEWPKAYVTLDPHRL